MIRKVESLVVAENILNLIMHEVDNSIEGFVNTFDNCREQGYVITAYDKEGTTRNVAFAQNRNSDNITIWFHEDYIFDLNKCSNKQFGYRETLEAVDFILGYLREGKA